MVSRNNMQNNQRRKKMIPIEKIKKTWLCPECKTPVGELHDRGCFVEKCPVCFGQYVFCDCLEEDQKKVGRIPCLLIALFCRLCADRLPEIFMVPDDEWKHFVPPNL